MPNNRKDLPARRSAFLPRDSRLSSCSFEVRWILGRLRFAFNAIRICNFPLRRETPVVSFKNFLLSQVIIVDTSVLVRTSTTNIFEHSSKVPAVKMASANLAIREEKRTRRRFLWRNRGRESFFLARSSPRRHLTPTRMQLSGHSVMNYYSRIAARRDNALN